MQISVDDAEYQATMTRRPHTARGVEIFVDGKRLSHCVSASEERGEVVRYRTNERGNFVLVGDVVATEVVRGSVSIELPSWWPVKPADG